MTEKLYRPPVVVVLGHVDHGKTTLLDYIRKTRVAEKEAGNITQRIGGYEITTDLKGYHTNKITFIDTPGHEAFTALRARGANVADIAILVVAATSSVQPQTIESIAHIKQSGIPFVVAANKIDMPNAQMDKVKQDLAKHEVLTEGFGGTIPLIPISARNGTGIDDLLEAILYLASEKNLTYSPNDELEAYVIEAHQDRAGSAAACIIKNGTLKVGETVYAGQDQAKVRSLMTDSGKSVKHVVPTQPFILFGFKEIPPVGVSLVTKKPDTLIETHTEQQATNFDDFFEKEETKKLRLILKTDSQGSLEALLPVLHKNENIEIIHSGIGDISKSDIFLARVSQAIVIGFNVAPGKGEEGIAKQEKVIIKTYNIIYNLFEELEEVSNLIKEKEEKEKSHKGEAKIQAVFTIEGDVIAGVKVTKGKIEVKDTIEVYRENRLQGSAEVISIKQRAKMVKDLKKDTEGGIHFEPQLDILVGDVIKSYSI